MLRPQSTCPSSPRSLQRPGSLPGAPPIPNWNWEGHSPPTIIVVYIYLYIYIYIIYIYT
jgi:hypothetical protein